MAVHEAPQATPGHVPEAELLTTDEAAALLRVSPSTLRFWRHTGNGGPKSFKIGRKRVFYYRADVDAWLARHYAEAVGS